ILADELDSTDVIEWLGSVLARAEAGIDGLFFEVDEIAFRRQLRWSWPLRVGVPEGTDGDAVANEVAAAIAANWPGIARVERPSEGVDKTDVLLVPDLPE